MKAAKLIFYILVIFTFQNQSTCTKIECTLPCSYAYTADYAPDLEFGCAETSSAPKKVRQQKYAVPVAPAVSVCFSEKPASTSFFNYSTGTGNTDCSYLRRLRI